MRLAPDEGFLDAAGVAAKTPGAEMDPIPEEKGGVLGDMKSGLPENNIIIAPPL